MTTTRSSPTRAIFVLLALVLAAAPGLFHSEANAATTVDQGRRVALVIGNGEYDSITRLNNPPNDAEDLAARLKKIGFEVTLGINLGKQQFRDTLRDFSRSMEGAAVSMFFYAGHGVQVDGENYALPVDAHVERSGDLEFEAFTISSILSLMERHTKVSLVFLDACRDNPLSRSLAARGTRSGEVPVGLAAQSISAGSYIAFATAPGHVALDGEGRRNSPFTEALLRHIDMPNTDVRMMMTDVRAQVFEETRGTQLPWENNSLIGRFYFVHDREAEAVARQFEELSRTQAAALHAWNAVSNSDSVAELELFRQNFPKSVFDDLAEARIRSLNELARIETTNSAAQAEITAWREALRVGTRESLQSYRDAFPAGQFAELAGAYLAKLSIAVDPDQNAVERKAFEDALKEGTAEGYERFKQAFPDSIYAKFADELISKLNQPEREPSPDIESLYWNTIKDSTVAGDFESFIRVYPSGKYTDLARNRLEQVENSAEVKSALGADDGQPLSKARLRQQAMERYDRLPVNFLQYGLKSLGFPVKKANGILDSATRKAIRQYQASIGAQQTGVLTAQQTLDLLFEAASAGDDFAQTAIGTMLAQGYGVEQNYELARLWFAMAAGKGNAYAKANLGILYRDGLGGPRDPAKARDMLQEAAEAGLDEAAEALRAL